MGLALRVGVTAMAPARRIVLVTGDGDFYELVRYLIKGDRFEKLLFPSQQNASSLYKKLGSEYFDSLGNNNVKSIIEYKK